MKKPPVTEANRRVMKAAMRLLLSCSLCPPNKGENAKRKPAHGKAKRKSKR